MRVPDPTPPPSSPGGHWFLRPAPGEEREFARLRKDGLLRRALGDVHVPADLDDCALLRAGACAAALPAPLRERVIVMTHGTAAWIHTGRTASGDDVPSLVEVAWPRSHGGAVPWPLLVRSGRTDPSHVVRVGPVWVTNRARTALDLLRTDTAAERDPEEVCERLGVDLAALNRCARQAAGLPGLAQLRRRLHTALPAATGA